MPVGRKIVEPKRYIFLKRRRVAEARLLGFAVSLILIGLPAELERGVAAEPDGALTSERPVAAVMLSNGNKAGHAVARPVSTAPGAPIGSPADVPAKIAGYDPKVLEAFASSAYKMMVIRDRWRPVMEQATASGPEEAAKARQAQAIELAQAVKAEGISPARYREIFTAAQRDPRFKSYLLSLVREVNSAPD